MQAEKLENNSKAKAEGRSNGKVPRRDRKPKKTLSYLLFLYRTELEKRKVREAEICEAKYLVTKRLIRSASEKNDKNISTDESIIIMQQKIYKERLKNRILDLKIKKEKSRLKKYNKRIEKASKSANAMKKKVKKSKKNNNAVPSN